jgi:hypothetical protein
MIEEKGSNSNEREREKVLSPYWSVICFHEIKQLKTQIAHRRSLKKEASKDVM